MALAFLNRCGFRATSNGTGDFVVASALTGMYAPASCAGPAVVDGAIYRYFAESDDRTQHEEGYGAWDDGTGTQARTVILSSSNSNNAVSFSAAPKVIMGGPLAYDAPAQELIAHFDFVTNPATSFSFDFDGFKEIEVHGLGVTIDQSAIDDDDSMYDGWVFKDNLNAALTTVDTFNNLLAHVSKPGGVLTENREINTRFIALPASEKAIFVVYLYDFREQWEGGAYTTHFVNGPSANWDVSIAGASNPVSVTVHGAFFDSSLGDYTTDQQFIAGKVWVYGKRT